MIRTTLILMLKIVMMALVLRVCLTMQGPRSTFYIIVKIMLFLDLQFRSLELVSPGYVLYLARSLKLATFVFINYHLHLYLLFKIHDMLLGRLGQAGAKENKLHEQLKGKVESLDCGEKWLNWGHNFGKYPLWLSYTVLYIFE